ncbi:MAG: cytochrome c3 family protein [Planctomycetota bacterium]|nr:cytochrome c3 family protein [Planctomycetota bacterium]
MTIRRSTRAHVAFLTLSLVFGALACAIHSTKHSSIASVAPQEWRKDRGPVVPHDSFPRDCATCHEGSSWHAIRDDFTFDHEKETGVALVGAHNEAECLRCHNDRGPVAQFATQGCVGCHEDIHAGKLGKNCTDCHEQRDWRPTGEIARHTRTRFPLVGSHAAVACFRCHAGADVGNFDRASIECADCHRDQLALAVNPNHAAQGWVDRCDRCHVPTTWNGAGFNHSAFPLTGQHAVTACTQCHTNGMYAGTPSACVACHQNDYNSVAQPNHVALNYPTTCQNCHNTSTWSGASFNHAGITSGCLNCHQGDFNDARDPNHISAGFPTTCQSCHNTSSWEGANFNHAGISRGCTTCHQSDFDATTNPNHASAGFPTTCNTCHTTATWSGATFNHSQFPISSGRHDNLTCQQCHNTPNNYTVFTCTNCHAHLQNDMNNDHDRVSGYSYTSSACFSCHPDGNK